MNNQGEQVSELEFVTKAMYGSLSYTADCRWKNLFNGERVLWSSHT